jgi:organic hydroperoxide reductase OsmC/OhrA
MSKHHHYKTTVEWTGNKGQGTVDYKSYERSHVLRIENKVPISCSADTPFRGDATKHNPEDMLLYALSSCHMLWYLHLCADAGIVVMSYTDYANGTMIQKDSGGGNFEEVTLNPVITIKNKNSIDEAIALHKKANACCFIANSVNFLVKHQPLINAED